MKRVIAVILLLSLMFLSGAFGSPDANIQKTDVASVLPPSTSNIIVGLGESVRVDLEPGAKVHVSNGSVVRSRIIGSTILMTGRRTGRTSLRVISSVDHSGPGGGGTGNGDKTVIVTERKVAQTARAFQDKVDSGRGMKFQAEALPALVISGELLRMEDWRDLVKLARESKLPWRLEARIFPRLRDELKSEIEKELTRLAWPGQKLSLGENGLQLTSGTDSSSVSADQKIAVTTLGLQLESSPGLTELEPMIRTQIVIAEVRKNRARELGVRWPDIAKAALIPNLQIPTESLLVDLKAMEQKGEGRILAMPTLLCRSGGDAKFLAGGEIPIKIASFRNAQVEWKKYGITLHVQPKADRMKRMKFQLTTEISTLDKATEMDGIPGILTNRIETQFNLNGPQTIVLSGLLKREEGTSGNGIPLLQSIPILGSLFGSESFRRNLTELLIFVSPEVVIPDQDSENE